MRIQECSKKRGNYGTGSQALPGSYTLSAQSSGNRQSHPPPGPSWKVYWHSLKAAPEGQLSNLTGIWAWISSPQRPGKPMATSLHL